MRRRSLPSGLGHERWQVQEMRARGEASLGLPSCAEKEVEKLPRMRNLRPRGVGPSAKFPGSEGVREGSVWQEALAAPGKGKTADVIQHLDLDVIVEGRQKCLVLFEKLVQGDG